MELPIEIRFKLTEREFLQSVRRSLIKHPFTWGLMLFTAFCAGLAVLSASPSPGPSAPIWLLLTVGGAIYLAYMFLVAPGRAYGSLNAAVRDSQLQYRFTSTGAEVKAESFQARWDWNLFSHFTEEKDSFVIYPRSRGNYILLPKRSFEAEENIVTLRQLLRSHLRPW